MKASISLILYVLLAVLVLSCSSGSGTDTPVSPVIDDDSSVFELTDRVDSAEGNRYTAGFWLCSVAEDHMSITTAPLRVAENHFNVTRLLEKTACTNCIQITNVHTPATGELAFDLTIIHPVSTLIGYERTVFDPRAIMITGSDYTFPESGRSLNLGSLYPNVLNPDGYTTLYNPTEYPEDGPLPYPLKYYEGKFANGVNLTSTLNPYIAYSKDAPRRMFLPGDSETQPVHLKVPPGELQFGYAIDFSWIPVDFAIIDPSVFPENANCLEAYQVSVGPVEQIGFYSGSTAQVEVEIFDHQGPDTISGVFIEAPDIFDGEIELEYSDTTGDDSAIYSGIIENNGTSPPGIHPAMMRVVDTQNDQNLGSVNAWMPFDIDVLTTSEFSDPVAIAFAEPLTVDVGEEVHFYDNGSYDPDGGEIVTVEWAVYFYDGDPWYSEVGPELYHHYTEEGTYYVQMKVTDNDGATDELDEPIEITVIEDFTFDNITDVTPLYFNTMRGGISPYNNYLFNWFYDSENLINLVIYDVADPANPTLVQEIIEPDSLYVTIIDGIGYKPVDGIGLELVDLTSPGNPQVIGFLDGAYTGGGSMMVDDGYLYHFYSHNLDIWDIDPVGDAYLAGSVIEESTIFPTFIGDVSNGYLYACNRDGQACYIFDVDPPETPELVYTMNPSGGVFDLAVKDDYLCSANWINGLGIYDISDPESPVLITNVAMPFLRTRYVEILGSDAYVWDEEGGMSIVDLTDPLTATADEWIVPMGYASSLCFENDRAYFFDLVGIAIVDNADPDMPSVSGYIPSARDALRIRTTENTLCVLKCDDSPYADEEFIVAQTFDISDPEDIKMSGAYYPGYQISDADIEGHYLYILSLDGTVMEIWDTDLPSFMNPVASTDGGNCIVVDDGLAYVGSDSGFSIFDVGNPGSPTLLNFIPTENEVELIDVAGGYTYIDNSGLKIYDTDPPESAYKIDVEPHQPYSQYALAASAECAGTMYGYYYYIDGWFVWTSVMVLYDVNPAEEAHSVAGLSSGEDLCFSGSNVFSVGYYLNIYDVEPPVEPPKVGMYHPDGGHWYGYDVEVVGNYAYVTVDLWDYNDYNLRILKLY